MRLTRIDANSACSKNIVFTCEGTSTLTKTKIFEVSALDSGVSLGVVKWHTGTRGYCFVPYGGSTCYDEECLRDIADFVEQINHRRPKTELAASRTVYFQRYPTDEVSTRIFHTVVEAQALKADDLDMRLRHLASLLVD
jgi:hypothetical protein